MDVEERVRQLVVEDVQPASVHATLSLAIGRVCGIRCLFPPPSSPLPHPLLQLIVTLLLLLGLFCVSPSAWI